MNEKTCLALVVDIQDRLMPAIDQGDQVIAKSEELLKGLKILGVERIATEQYPRGLGATVANLMPYLNPDHLYAKTQFNSLMEEVKAHIHSHTESVILLGAETHICVYQTALAFLEDYPQLTIYLAEEACGSRNPYHKALAVDQLRAEGVKVVSNETLLYQLMKDAKHPQFKAISALIK